MPTTNLIVTATYNLTTNEVTLNPTGNYIVPKGYLLSLTINLVSSSSLPPGGRVVFAGTGPITWGESSGPPPGVIVTGAGTATLHIEELNANTGSAAIHFPFSVNVTYAAAISQDPTIVNEGTGGD